MQIGVLSTLTVYHDGQFWVGLAEHVEGGRYGVARIAFGAEPSNEEIPQFVASKWAKLAFFGDEATETSKPAKNPKRRAREAAKAEAQAEASRALTVADMGPGVNRGTFPVHAWSQSVSCLHCRKDRSNASMDISRGTKPQSLPRDCQMKSP